MQPALLTGDCEQSGHHAKPHFSFTFFPKRVYCYIGVFNVVLTIERRTMEQKDLDFFKNLLNERMNDLLSHADDTVSGMTQPKDNFADPTDRASHEANRNFELRIRDREHKLIKKIKKALDRIENGTFGICETCEEDISPERLKARPVTTQCIECKKREEDLERALGI